MRPTRAVSLRSREGFRDILRALWRRGREVCTRRHSKVFLRARRGARGEVFFGASQRVRGREARRGLQPGDVRSSLRQCGEVCSPATCEVLFGARRRERARRRTICSPAMCSACRRGRRRGGLQVHSPASWRCFPRRVSAWAKARWPVLYQLRAASGATGQLSGIRLGLWASASGDAAQSAYILISFVAAISFLLIIPRQRALARSV